MRPERANTAKVAKAARRLTAFLAVLAVALLGINGVGSADPAQSVVGNLETEFEGTFSPKVLPGGEAGPIAASFSWKAWTREGVRPPALREFVIRGDHVELDVEGLPRCRMPGRNSRLDSAAVRKKCGQAVVGNGRITVGVEFAGEVVIDAESKLLAIKGGPTGLYLHAFFRTPITGTIIVPVEVKRFRGGRPGTELLASIPKVAGGSGSATAFRLGFDRGILRAACPDGRLKAEMTAIFENDLRITAGIEKPCDQAESAADRQGAAS